MNRSCIFVFSAVAAVLASCASEGTDTSLPWDNGPLTISPEGRYLMHENGTPFFWLADTGWLLPERTGRDDVIYYLDSCQEQEYNVVLVQTVNDVPSVNAYGEKSMPDGFDCSEIDKEGVYGYWDHMDFIVSEAAERGIYVGMVCIWGGLVKKGLMDQDEAVDLTKISGRYKDLWVFCPKSGSVEYIGRKKDAIYCFCPNDSVDCVLIATDSKSDYGHRLSTYL